VRVWSYPQYVTVTSGSPPFSLSTIVPTNPPSSGGSGSSGGIVLETNGTLNANQGILNIESGTGIAVTNPSSGNVLITNTGGTGGTSFSTAGQGGFLGPGILTSLYAPYWGQSAQPLDDSANVVDVFQFVLDSAWTIRNCTFVWSNNYPGTCSFAIYSVAGSKLIDSGTFDLEGTTNTPVQNTFTAVVLPPGVYWFAQAGSGPGLTCPALVWQGSSTPGAAVLAMLNTPQITAGVAANARSTGVMPSTLGTITALTNQGLYPAAPFWTP
jgi:hypothetical protein